MSKKIALFMMALALLAAAYPAQPQSGPHRIGLLGPPEEPRFSEVREGLKEGLLDLGYAEGSVEILEARVPRRDEAALRAAVERLIRERVKVLFAIGSSMARPARRVSADLPMVYLTPGDPVRHGLAKSLARPGGNTTAMTFEHPELAGKRLEILKEMLPGLRRVLIIYDPRDSSPMQGAEAARRAARQLGLTLVEREARGREDVARGLEALGEADAFLVIPGGVPTGHYAEIIRAANARRIPTMFHARAGSTMEALASYGTGSRSMAREMARQVDKILKGAKAGDLPVERPIKFDFIINLKTAKQIGLTIPPEVLQRADRVIR